MPHCMGTGVGLRATTPRLTRLREMQRVSGVEGVTAVHIVGRSDSAGIGSGQADSNATSTLDCITIRGNPVVQAEGSRGAGIDAGCSTGGISGLNSIEICGGTINAAGTGVSGGSAGIGTGWATHTATTNRHVATISRHTGKSNRTGSTSRCTATISRHVSATNRHFAIIHRHVTTISTHTATTNQAAPTEVSIIRFSLDHGVLSTCEDT
jgi:hypothetical protein